MNSISICFNLGASQRGFRYKKKKYCSRVTSWLYEVQASMDTVINNLHAIDTVFLLEVRVKTRLYVFDDGFPTGGERQARSVASF
jgi:hypothetical protein